MANQPPYPPGQPYSPPAQQPKKGMSTCLIIAIVVAVISVPLIGIMAATAIYGVRRYLASAKTAEAKNTVGAIARSAVAAYEREPMPGDLGLVPAHQLCASAARVPAMVPPAKKYQPSSADGADFNAGDQTHGWKCLKFALTQPIHYAYRYETGAGSGKSGATAAGFEASAQGDLNGDGVTSFFARGADVRNQMVVLSTSIYIENEFE